MNRLSISILHHLTKWVSIESISQSPYMQCSSWSRELFATVPEDLQSYTYILRN